MKSSLAWWRKRVLGNLWFSLTLLIFLFCIFSVLIFYHFEHEYDVSLTIIESFRIVLVNFLGEPYDAHTTMGKIMLFIVFVLGIFAISALIGKIAAIFVHLESGPKIPQNIEDHIVICHWHENGDHIIKELHAEQAEPNLNIIVITESDINEIALRKKRYYKHVFFLYGDPGQNNILEEAGIFKARSIIILSDPADSDPDAQSVMITLAITRCDKKISDTLRIIAEVTDHQKSQHLRDAGVSELICATDFSFGILSQTALYTKMSEVYKQLLSYSGDTNEIYLLDTYPDWFYGKTFKKLSEILNEQRDEGEPVILIGIKRESEVILNPKEHHFDTLQKNDHLILVAFDAPNLSNFCPLTLN